MKDVLGRWRTLSLFIEFPQDGYEPIWTLRETTWKDYPSLREIYLSYAHVPGNEYNFAQEVIGSWDHWNRLCRSHIAKDITSWREELDIKLKANAIKNIIATSKEGGASGTTAAKYLADKGYAATRGRPSKAEKEALAKQESRSNNDLDDDLERVGLKLVGTK